MEHKFEWFYNKNEDTYYAKINNITFPITKVMVSVLRGPNRKYMEETIIEKYNEKLINDRNNKIVSLGI